MAKHRFVLYLDVPGVNLSIEDRLYEAKCNDALLSSSGQTVSLSFDREAPSYDKAVESAIKAVESVGIRVRGVWQALKDQTEPSLPSFEFKGDRYR